MVNGIEGNQLHFLHIGFAILGQILLITEDIDDFSNKVVSSLALIYLLLHTAFQRHRELLEHRRIHIRSLFNSPARFLHLVRRVSAADNAYIVRGYHRLSGCKSYCQLWIHGQIVRCLMGTE